MKSRFLLLTIFLFVLLLTLLCSCGGQTPTAPTGPEETITTDPPAKTAQTEEPASNDPHHVHEFGGGVIVKEPTCLEDGVEERYCACGEKTEVVIEAPGHTPGIDPAVPATCTGTGLTEGSHCIFCGTVLIERQTVPAKGHAAAFIRAVAPTCTESGLTEGSRCISCGLILTEQTELPPLGHDYCKLRLVETPDCEKGGKAEYVCSRCGQSEIRDTAPLGHTVVSNEGKEPRCTALGVTGSGSCTVCGKILTAPEPIPALGHDFKNNICTRCGKTTGSASETAFNLIGTYIRFAGKNNGGVYRQERETVRVGSSDCLYVWSYCPSNDYIELSLEKQTADGAVLSVRVSKADTYLSFRYDLPSSGAHAFLRGEMDFDDFRLDANELPYCECAADSAKSLQTMYADALSLAKALWNLAEADAGKFGFSLRNLG